MRTKVLNHFHTFHSDSQADLDRLMLEEQKLTRLIAREGGEEPRKVRASEKPRDLQAELETVRAHMDECREQIKSGVVRITIKGLTRGEFRRLLIDHPAREDDPLDQRLGYNCDTFGEALIQACILGTHDLDGNPVPNEWDEWADDMTAGQWQEVFEHCLKLTNEGNPSFPQ